jgi:DNA-binding MarR family transcriptional regulator
LTGYLSICQGGRVSRKPVAPSPVDASQAVALGLAVKRLRARLRAESATTSGWTISQLSTLARIVNEGPITASALAQVEHVRPQSIAEILATLKTDRLVSAAPDPTDGRKSLISATAEGREVVRSVSASREAWLSRAIDSVLEPGEHATLDAAIELLNRLAECDLRGDEHGWRG